MIPRKKEIPMTNYMVAFKDKNKYAPILVMEGEDKETVIEYFETFRDMLFKNGIKKTVYLLRIDDEKLDQVEHMVAVNVSKSEKLTEIVTAFLEMPDDKYRWN